MEFFKILPQRMTGHGEAIRMQEIRTEQHLHER